MWSATIGMVLMVMGFTVALGPVLYGVHLALIDERERQAATVANLAVVEETTLCPFCGEVVHGDELVHAGHEPAYAAS